MACHHHRNSLTAPRGDKYARLTNHTNRTDWRILPQIAPLRGKIYKAGGLSDPFANHYSQGACRLLDQWLTSDQPVHTSARADIVAKVESCGDQDFSRNTKQRAFADSYDLNRVIEVACEFCVRPRGPSHLVNESRAHGPQNFGHRRKTTFATISANSGHWKIASTGHGLWSGVAE
jgi:hypothetical protein